MNKKRVNSLKSRQLLNTIATLSTITLLSGCAVGPDYNGVPKAQYKNLHNVKSSKNVTSNNNLGKWWINFKDEELEKIISHVLKENLDLNASIARIQQARALVQYTGANLFAIFSAEIAFLI